MHRMLAHFVNQYLYRMESLLVLKQPCCIVLQVNKTKVGGFSKHQNKTSDTDRNESYFFHRSNLNTRKTSCEKRSELLVKKVSYFMYCPVVIRSPALSFDMKRKQSNNGVFVSSPVLYSIRLGCIMKECMWTMSYATSGLRGSFPPNITPNSLPTLLPKMCPMSALRKSRPDP